MVHLVAASSCIGNLCAADPAPAIVAAPQESHAVTVFKKHLARRFGSTVAAWRKSFGNGALVPFQKFREACQDRQPFDVVELAQPCVAGKRANSHGLEHYKTAEKMLTRRAAGVAKLMPELS